MSLNKKSGNGVAIAIFVAGLLIAGAVLFSGAGGRATGAVSSYEGESRSGGDFRLPNDGDHIRGNSDAVVTIVEFSDLECPFCARLHPTVKRLVSENSDVSWVYRHFPLSTIHSRALSAAVASECVARLGGNDNFWAFTDLAFENQRNLGDSWYKETAVSLGIDASAFESCLADDDEIVSRIRTDFNEATGTGGRGTPYVVVVAKSGNLIPFSGALPYEQISAIVEQARNN